MKWLLTTFLLSVLAYAHALDLTREELRKIIAQPSSADVIADLRLYPAGESRFRLKINLADGTSDFVEYSAQQRYVDGQYVVITPQPTPRIPLHMVRTYDPKQRLFFGWDLYADGTIMNQSGMYDSERKIMSWINDGMAQGKHFSLRSIQSFADRSLITWKGQLCVDEAFQLEMHGECQSVTSDHKP